MSSTLEKKLAQRINQSVAAEGGLAAITPGLKIQVWQAGRLKIDLAMGDTYQYYDLASLTKIIFAVPAVMRLSDEFKLRISDKIESHLAWWRHSKIRVSNVLSHSAGLSAWAPIYKAIQKSRLKTDFEKREYLYKFLARQKLNSTSKAVYSDLDFLLLGFLIEKCEGQELVDIWRELPVKIALKSLHFNQHNKPKYLRSTYAPTEKCPWRKKILRGEVHDDNTWSLGGVSTHAGLFGTIDDVSQFGLAIRKGMRGEKQFLARPETVQLFTRRAISQKKGDWALGFMMPTKGQASCGKYFSRQSVGHTGFTGTSLWFDPKKDLLVTILSNRVHPTRDNRLFVALRPKLHDFVVEALNSNLN